MFLSREIDMKLCQNIRKFKHIQFCTKVGLNRSNSANTQPKTKNEYIPQEPEYF